MQVDAGCRLLPAGLATPNVLPDFSHTCFVAGGAPAGKKQKNWIKRCLTIAPAELRLCWVTLGCTGSSPSRWRVRSASSLGVNGAGVGSQG